MGRRKSSKNDLARPTPAMEAPPPVPPLPSFAPVSAPTTPNLGGGASTASSIRSSAAREKKITRVAVPAFDPESEVEKATSSPAIDAEEREEILDDAPSDPQPSTSAVAAIEPLAEQLDTPVAEKSDPSSPPEDSSPISNVAKGLLAGLVAVPALGVAAVAGFQRGVDEEDRKDREGEEVDLAPASEVQQPVIDATSHVPPPVEVDVEQMEQVEPLADLVDTASHAEHAMEESNEVQIAEDPFGPDTHESSPTPRQDGQMDVAQFVLQDEAIAAAEVSESSSTFPTPTQQHPSTLDGLPPLGPVVNSDAAVPSTSSVPEATAIEALLSSPPPSATATPLSEIAESTALAPGGDSVVTSRPVDEVVQAPFDGGEPKFGSPTFELSPPPAVAQELRASFSNETMRAPEAKSLAGELGVFNLPERS